MFDETILDRVHRLQNGLIAEATGQSFDGGDDEYKKLRSELARIPSLKHNIPKFIRRCSDLAQFWGWIKYEKGTYAERRSLLWEAFAPMIEKLEYDTSSPLNTKTTDTVKIYGPADVHEHWNKATDRIDRDTEGAITLARTLLEATCKSILTDLDVSYSKRDDVPKLWRMCAEELNLSPSHHHQDIFKSILGNCTSIVSNLSSLRNKLGDAHVDQPIPVKPKARHASLAVNLSGTMATFITETWLAKKENP